MIASYSSIVAKLVERLDYYSAKGEGRLLDGVKFKQLIEREIEGDKDLPQVALEKPVITESYRSRLPVTARMTLRLYIATKRSLGITEHVRLIERVLDVLETETDGTIDPYLGGTLRMPFSVATGEEGDTDLSMNTALVLSVTPKRTPLRGQRSES